MQTQRNFLFAAAVLVFSILGCNLPNLESAEATRATATMMEAPVTIIVIVEETATATLTPTETPIPFTPTPDTPPEITLSKNSNCRAGPNNRYNIIDQITQGKVLPVVGRNEDNTWWQVVNTTNRECWIFNENALPNMDLSFVSVGEAPPLPVAPQGFQVVDQLCQPGANQFSVTVRWSSGGGDVSAYRIYRDGKRIIEVKPDKFNYKDVNAPLNKNLTYEIEAINENGASERAIQIVPACK